MLEEVQLGELAALWPYRRGSPRLSSSVSQVSDFFSATRDRNILLTVRTVRVEILVFDLDASRACPIPALLPGARHVLFVLCVAAAEVAGDVRFAHGDVCSREPRAERAV